MRKLLAACALAVVALTAAPAIAHVTVQPNEAPTGAFFKFNVRVPNERDDAGTTKVTVHFPENLIFVSFQPKAGWKRSVKMKKLDTPIEAFGAKIDTVVDTVTWTGGMIKPGEFDEFGFSARVPEEAGTIEFHADQTYSSGEVVKWAGAPDSEEPAPLVSIIALGGEEGQGQLAVLAQLKEQMGGGAHETPSDDGDDDDYEEEDDDSDLSDILSYAGVGLGALALVVALMKKK
ncbi:MAG TPA: YcnI family protein [Actinomycetota bacterium]|nr:YcnI family protein [Actinomycetota bacterium]